MADSRRQQIVSALITLLKGITVANGYETDVGQRVFQWRDLEKDPFTETEAASLAVYDTEETTEWASIATKRHQYVLKIEVDIHTPSATPDTTIRKIVADIAKRLGTDRRLGGLADDLGPAAGQRMKSVIGIKQGGTRRAGGTFEFWILYRTQAFDPYNA